MTHSGGKPHAVGDRGQRYEVVFKMGDGTDVTFGWANSRAGAGEMIRAITKHPVWHSARIIDRVKKG